MGQSSSNNQMVIEEKERKSDERKEPLWSGWVKFRKLANTDNDHYFLMPQSWYS